MSMLESSVIRAQAWTSKSVLRRKVLIVGEACVGKTSIINVLMTNKFTADYKLTMDPQLTVFPMKAPMNDTSVELFLYDLPGNHFLHPRGKQLGSHRTFSNVDCLVCVCDINDRKSYKAIPKWIQMMKHYARKVDELQIIIVMNKSDIQITEPGAFDDNACPTRRDEISSFVKEHGYESFECSAFLNKNVREIFASIVSRACKNIEN